MNKKLIIGSDHAGYILKNDLCKYLTDKGLDLANIVWEEFV